MDFKSIDFSELAKQAEVQGGKQNTKKEGGAAKKSGFDPKMIPYIMQMVGMFLSPKIKALLISAVIFAVIGFIGTLYFLVYGILLLTNVIQ